jgi:hypothetical protein
LFSIPRFAPNAIDISRPLLIQSTAPSRQFLYNNIKKIMMSETAIRHYHYLPNINTLELNHSIPFRTISSTMDIGQIKYLTILLSDDLISCLPSISTMSHLCVLSIGQINLTMYMIKQMSDYRFKQILKLGINVDENKTDYIIEKLFIIFPNIQCLTLECPIRSKDIIILVIDMDSKIY